MADENSTTDPAVIEAAGAILTVLLGVTLAVGETRRMNDFTLSRPSVDVIEMQLDGATLGLRITMKWIAPE